MTANSIDSLAFGTAAIDGTPDADAQWWPGQQTQPTDCDIRSQQYILQQFTHQPVDEQQLISQATQNGWYDPTTGGTPPQDAGALLQAHGIPVTEESGTIQTLESELSQGHKVIVGVDAGQLETGIPDGHADHAVVVSGVDVSDPNNPTVIVSDPGTGQAEAHYSLSQFQSAWDASGDLMVATRIAPHAGGGTSFFSEPFDTVMTGLEHDLAAMWDDITHPF
jgi:hypothetical protein